MFSGTRMKFKKEGVFMNYTVKIRDTVEYRTRTVRTVQ